MNKKIVSPILFVMLAFSNASGYAEEVSASDPLHGFNHAMFAFNEKLDQWLIKPIATIYNKIVPKPLNKGINNFFNNFNTMPTIANDLLQFNFYQSANDMWRMGVNTTVGIGGIFDVASRMQLKPYTNDFGLTLGKWGYENSTYIVWPLFGPSTIRDGVSIPVDYFAFSLYPYIDPPSFRYQLYGMNVIDRRAQLLKFQDITDEASINDYDFRRNAYLQRRAFQIKQTHNLSYSDRGQPQPSLSVSSSEVSEVDLSEEPVVNESPANTWRRSGVF